MSTIAMHTGIRPTLVGAPTTRGAAPKPRLRMTARGRAVLLTVLAVPLAAGIAFGAMNGGAADATKDAATVPLEFVTVTPGETLWGIATEIAPHEDPRDVISDLMSFNQLPSASVPAGLQLAVPPKYAS